MKNLFKTLCVLALSVQATAQTNYNLNEMKMEKLNRGVVALRASKDSVMISWRYLPTDPMDTRFAVLRNGKQIAEVGDKQSTTWMDYNPEVNKSTVYEVKPISADKATCKLKGKWTLPANAPTSYIDIKLNKPKQELDVNGRYVNYIANDATAADLDGDGEMEIILKWDPSNSKDNSHSGVTNNTYMDAYKLNGKHLWRIDLGKNIRSGAHYTQFLVYDFNGDGCAELVMRTSDGSRDAKGKVIGDDKADWRVGMEKRGDQDYYAPGHMSEQFRKDQYGKRGGHITDGPDYLTVFNGKNGSAITTIDYVPQRGDSQSWGDNYSNRSDRFLACVAYLDGIHPSIVMCRGYYTRMVLAAFDFDGKKLKQRWVFDSNNEERKYTGQGNHNLRVGDVDGDGKDEICYGSCTIDHDGKGLYSLNMGHGDAMHLTSFFPLDDRLQIWDCHENRRDGAELHDAKTGEILLQFPMATDVGRCMAADIDDRYPGLEVWAPSTGGLRSCKGELIDANPHVPVNFGIWWDGDLLREMLDHEMISKYKYKLRDGEYKVEDVRKDSTEILHMDNCEFNNGTKSNPCLAADILGDWREEVVVRTKDSEHLRIYSTTLPTPYRFHTFLRDPVYRHSLTAQNIAYNQPTQVGFYFGAELKGSGRLFRGWQF